MGKKKVVKNSGALVIDGLSLVQKDFDSEKIKNQFGPTVESDWSYLGLGVFVSERLVLKPAAKLQEKSAKG